VLRTSGTKPIGAGTFATASSAPTGTFAPATFAALAPAPLADPVFVTPTAVNTSNVTSAQFALTAPYGAVVTYTLTDGTRTVTGTVTFPTSGSQTLTASVNLSAFADGIVTASVTYVDINGWVVKLSASFAKDTTPPTISVSVGAPTNGTYYDVGATLAFSFSGSDITSATLDGQTISSGPIDLDTLTAGIHTIVVRGIDAAGNVTTRTITFTIRATVKGLQAAVKDGAAKGFITAAEVVTLTNLLTQAASNTKKYLPNFVTEVQKQSGKAITAAYAALLVNWANDLLAH
jgi:hypothetical protein